MSRAQIVVRNTLWSALDLVLGVVIAPVLSVLVARALGPTKLGAYNYILWISQTALLLGAFGVPSAVRKYLAEYFGRNQPQIARAIIRTAVVFQTWTGGAIVALGLAITQLRVPPGERLYASLAILSVFPAALMAIATSINTARDDFRANVLPSVVSTVAHVLGVGATLVFGWGLVGLAASLLLYRILDSALRWIPLLGRMRQSTGEFGGVRPAPGDQVPPKDVRREMVAFCAQSTSLLLLNVIVWNRSETFFLKLFCDVREVAYFSVALGLAALPGQLAQPFSWAAGASLLNEQGRSTESGQQFANAYWRYLAVIVVPTSLGLAVLSGPAIGLLYGAAYAPAIPVAIIASTLGVIPLLVDPATILLIGGGGQGLLVRWGCVSAAITLLLDVWLVQADCARGGAVANALGRSAATVATWLIAARGFGFRIPLGFVARLGLAGATMAALVALVAWVMPAGVALVLGPLLGAAVYVTLLRLGKVLSAEDAQRLASAEGLLPQAAKRPYRFFLSWAVGERGSPSP